MAASDGMTEAEKEAYWKEQRRAFNAKNEALFDANEDGWCWCPPQDFYEALFAGVELEDAGCTAAWDEPGGGRPNAMAIEITHETKTVARRGAEREVPVVNRYMLHKGFDVEPLFRKSIRDNTTFFCAPVTYFGRRRTAANARYLHAFAVDLDGVDGEQLRHVVLQQMRMGTFPQASAIVNSGTGLHLYYLLDEPAPLLKCNVRWLQALKRALTDRVWNEDTSSIEDRQYQGIYQAFRMPGTVTKLNGAKAESKKTKYVATAFAHLGDDGRITRASLEYLRSMVAVPKGSPIELPLPAAPKGGTPLEEAREKWPDWYERVVVSGEEPGKWQVKRDLYDWWLRKLREPGNVGVGHRYHCLHALSAFGDKCGIPKEEVEEDALGFLDVFEAMTDAPDNHFTDADVMAAVDSGFDGTRLTRDHLEAVTAIPFPPKSKRNGRTRSAHMKRVNRIADMDVEDGEPERRNRDGRPKGSLNKHHPKRDAVLAYHAEHPDANHSEIARALGVSRPTVIKWLKTE